ncbi:helix-turn-helix domain-containing protein [Hymenobacter koreensis]|uniref:winged helix-turn-helix transcriptional regulator n=1 Tax=Hymenobacter koreensis TaxID=1084523 RepID=UPI0031EE1145
MRTALDLLGGKWRLLLLQQIALGQCRYGQFRRALPDISEKVLAQELRNLTEAGLVVRGAFGETAARGDYALTEGGRQALPVLEALLRFGLGYTTALQTAGSQ